MTPHVAATVRAGIAGLVIVASATIAVAQTAAPTFSVRAPFDIGAIGPRDAVAVDFDHDTDLDLVVTAGNAIAFMAGDGTGLLVKQNSVALNAPAGITVADFNRDGASDIAVAQPLGGACGMAPGISIYLGTSPNSTSVALSSCVSSVPSPVAVQAGDFNADGLSDLAVATSVNGIFIVDGNGNGTFRPVRLVNSSGGGGTAQDFAAPADLEGDGDLDLVLGSSASVRFFLNNGSGVFTIGPVTQSGNNTLAVAAADFDRDGRLDLAAIEATGQMRVSRQLVSGAFENGQIYPLGPGGVADLAIADMDSDGDMDISVAAGSQVRTVLFLNNGSGVFAVSPIPALGPDPFRAFAGDFNGDGLSDVAMIGPRQFVSAQVFVALQDFRDRVAPTVEITSPADGSSVSGMVSITAMALDNVGVARVEFFANGAAIGGSTGPEFGINWDASALAGAYTITARAFDAAGNSAVDAVSVNVADTAAPSAPAGFTASVAGKFDADFTWVAATDNLGVDHYRLYELDRKSEVWEVVVDNITGTSAGLEGIKPRGQLHTFAVSAVDAAGNE